MLAKAIVKSLTAKQHFYAVQAYLQTADSNRIDQGHKGYEIWLATSRMIDCFEEPACAQLTRIAPHLTVFFCYQVNRIYFSFISDVIIDIAYRRLVMRP